MSRSPRAERDERRSGHLATPPRPPGRPALRTLGATARTALETLTADGFDDFGAGYGPGACLVLSAPAGAAQ